MMGTAEAETANNGTANSILATPKWPSSRRTPSLSSNSSSSSSSSFRSCSREHSPPPSPTTPLSRFAAGGIPFSWETIPGIPKKQILKKIDSCRNHNYLPLPPAAAPAKSNHDKKHFTSRKDPFFAALVECSKGGGNDDDKTAFGSNFPRPGRILGDRFRFVNNMSCKSFSAVTESLVFFPRGPRRIDYDVAKKRSG